MTELLIEADHIERQYWRDLLALPGVVFLLYLAGFACALQANGRWDQLVAHQAFANDAGPHGCIRTAGQNAGGWACPIRFWFFAACYPGSFFPWQCSTAARASS